MSFAYWDEFGNLINVERTEEGGFYFHTSDAVGGVGLEVPEFEIWDLINFLIKAAP